MNDLLMTTLIQRWEYEGGRLLSRYGPDLARRKSTAPARESHSNEAQPRQSSTVKIMKARVLTVAEDQSTRTAVSQIFHSEDYGVLSVRDEHEAASLLRWRDVDLVAACPDGDVQSATKVIRTIKEVNQFTPIILIVEPGERTLDDYRLADAIISRPVDVRDLLRAAEFLLDPSADLKQWRAEHAGLLV